MVGVWAAGPQVRGGMCHGLVQPDVYGFSGVELLFGSRGALLE
jgi:hypothetical protein